MKIKKIKFKNFRQFNGEHTIEFSTDADKNITVIHAENGSGKTTLLNAFKWAFYEVTDLDTGDARLLNNQALAETAENCGVEFYVQVDFEHDDLHFEARRTQKFIKADGQERKNGAAWLDLSSTGKNGFEVIKNPDVRIKQILPKNLHDYFFFHGERIQGLASINGTEQVREAIKNLMGIEVVERALNHLETKVKKNFNNEKKKFASAKDAELLQNIEDLDARISSRKKENANHNKAITEATHDLDIIGQKIAANKETEALQNRRKEIEENIRFNKDRLTNISVENRHLINSKGLLAFFKTSAAEVALILEERRKKGELPYKVKRQFIEDLLQSGKCICGTDLVTGSAPHAHLEQFKSVAGGADLEEGYMNTTGALSNVASDAEDLRARLKGSIKEAEIIRGKNDKLSQEMDAISDKIKNSGIEEVSKLEARGNELRFLISKVNQEIGKNNSFISQASEERVKLDKQYKEEAEKSGKSNLANKKFEIACACKDALQAIIDAFSNEIREKLSERIKETVDKILRNEYQARIDDNYALRFYQKTPSGLIEVPDLSSGQRVVASLSFVASIIDLAKKKYHSDRTNEYFSGGLYPLVMDTPFGNTDDGHSENIASFIPELADQVIILASNKNWSKEIDKICRLKIGKEYSLIHFSPNPKNDIDQNFERKSETGYEHSKLEEGHYGG